MACRIARGVFKTENTPLIEGYGSVAGKKEGEGPLGKCFDVVEPDGHLGEETWERRKASSRKPQ